MRGWVFPVAAAAAYAQTYQAAPEPVRQGDTIHLRAPQAAERARLNGRTVRLFAEGDAATGLMPVPALEKPGVYTLEFLGGGGAVLDSEAVTVRDARFPTQRIVLARETAELKPTPGEMEESDAFRKNVSDARYWMEPFALPVPGCRTSPYGVGRVVNGKLTGSYHAGIDQRGPAGQPVRAITAGTVRLVRQWNIHGNTVAVDHGQGVESMYLHLSKFAVSEGAAVKRGDVIGYIGTTGRSTAPHLHWSLYVNGVPVNPAQWVKLQACAAVTGKGKAKGKK
jgi:murein DD-endopeptidase MepM/ murein hydrolase activator NlpD